MNLDKDFLNILCCPNRFCRADLVEKDQATLECTNCQHQYPVKEGIPILFPNVEYSPDVHKRHWDLDENATSYASKYNSYLKKQGTPWGLYTHTSELRAIDTLVKGVKLDLKNKVILDCGSGNGRLLSTYPQARIKIGIDASLALLIDNKRREPDFWLVCGQLEDMPFKDSIADFSTSIRVFQHIKVPEDAFSEMVRTTKPAGYVSLEVYNKFNLKELYKRIRMTKFMDKMWPWGLDYDRYYSYREIEKWCSQNFVKPLKYSGAGWGIHFYLFELIKFRGLAPKPLQKIVYNFFLALEGIIGTWPFFSVTLEKVCFIGSIQALEKKPTIFKRLKNKLRRQREIKDINNFQLELNDRNYSLVGDDRQHLNLTIDWLKKAQDKTADGGVSRGVSLVYTGKGNDQGWQPSYPETTGYIIPTMLKAAQVLNNQDLARRAKLMADWERNIMFSDGAVHGGNIAMLPNKAIFDTGQVIRGLEAIYQLTKDDKYLKSAMKSADWILSNEHNSEGRWIEHNAAMVSQQTTTYNVYAIAPLLKLGLEHNRDDLKQLGLRTAEYTVSQQNENSWFKDADFEVRDDYLLHTIGYTIDGLWDIGVLLKHDKFLNSAQQALDQVINQMDDQGKIPGRLNSQWQGTVDWVCLTGSAQIGVTCMKVYRKTHDQKYFEAAAKLKEFLKTCQNNFDENYGGGLGAVWGSWPIKGKYGQYQALNWPAKYFADLLIEFIGHE